MSPVAECLNASSLQALVKLRASTRAAKRMAGLAAKANEGLLTDDERSEYQSCLMFANFLGVLQSKARRKLNAAG